MLHEQPVRGRPRPVMAPESDAGICGDAVLTSAWDWLGDCTVSIGVPKAALTWPLIRSPAAAWNRVGVSPRSGPRRAATEVTSATSLALGPNSAAYCAAVRYWRYCGDPGVDTAATACARPGGILTGQGHIEVEDLGSPARPDALAFDGSAGAGWGSTTFAGPRRAAAAAARLAAPASAGARRHTAEHDRPQRGGNERAPPPMTPLHESASLPRLVPPGPSAPWGDGS